MQDYIIQSIQEGIRLKENILNNRQMLADIENVGNLIVQALRQGHKVLLCGNGGSAADAQHIAAELVGRFVTEREGLPAIAMTTDTSILTAVSNDYGFERVFERQTADHGREHQVKVHDAQRLRDVLANVEYALQKAQSMGIITVGLLGRNGGRCKELCNYPLIIQHTESARIQEVHITIGHILCGIVDNKLFSHE